MTRKKKPITEEEFAGWRDDPVTQWVSKLLHEAADAQLTAWLRQSWEGGDIDPMKLKELRTRADAYHSIADFEFTDFAKLEIAE